MKTVCIGVGGSGAASLETIVHLAAIGLFPPDCEIVPVAVDPDRGHPRITGMTTFLSAYDALRAAGQASDLNNGSLFGTRIVRNLTLNASKPADHESLFGVLGLADKRRRALAGLFFRDEEIGNTDSHDFANGYYGRANAGVCFFSDPDGKARLLTALRRHLLRQDARVILIGSTFGGTGAAGLVHVARTIRDDDQLRNQRIPIAVVQLEPYFKPDASAVRQGDFVNLPATFERRTGAAYQFLFNLTANNNVPFDVLYPLGERTPTVFPPDWFKRDQQDNPHLWLEYLAALAVRDFATNTAEDCSGEARLRRVALPPSFGEPLASLRRTLWACACDYSVMSRLVLPLLTQLAKDVPVPGHPWMHDLITESGLTPTNLVAHFESSMALLKIVLGHVGVLGAEWRSTDWRNLSDEERQRFELMTQKTRDSFPAGFLRWEENLDARALLASGNPATAFDTYSRASGDVGLPVRSLHRWVLESLELAIAPQTTQGARDYQLVQQEDRLDVDGQVLSLPSISDDSFTEVDGQETLRKLARASWKSPDAALVPKASEYPSIWAPAVVYRHALYQAAPSDETSLVYLGLLYLALMQYKRHTQPPVFAFRLDHLGLESVVRSTFPMPNYDATYGQGDTVLALYHRDEPVLGQDVPVREEVVGFFYPDTLVVPAAGLSSANRIALRDLGAHASGVRFPQLVRRICEDWPQVLAASGIPDANTKGSRLDDYLARFVEPGHGAVSDSERYRQFPYTAAPGWIQRLYAPLQESIV